MENSASTSEPSGMYPLVACTEESPLRAVELVFAVFLSSHLVQLLLDDGLYV